MNYFRSSFDCTTVLRRFLLAAMLATTTATLAQQPATNGIQDAKLIDTLPLRGTLYHVQGVDLDRDHIWVTSVDTASRKGYLHQFNRRTGAFERQVDVSDGDRFHPGGFSLAGNSIWVPVAEYKRDSSAILLELDRVTLKVKRKISVADHIGCVAVTPDGTLIAGNWSSRKLYVLDREGKQLRVVPNPSTTEFQDMKFVKGMLVGGGNTPKHPGKLNPGEIESGDIVWLSWPSLEVMRRLAAGTTDHGRLMTAEGMALKGDDLYLLPEDGPSRLFRFRLASR